MNPPDSRNEDRPSRSSLPSGKRASTCPSCGYVFETEASLCPQCGHPLSTAFPAARGSRASFTPAAANPSKQQASQRLAEEAPDEFNALPWIVAILAVAGAGAAGWYLFLLS